MMDIPEKVPDEVMRLWDQNGIRHNITTNTTASIVMFEKTDPSLKRDFLSALSRIAPADINYASDGGNSPAHIKSAVCGQRVVVPVKDGQLFLGKWQGIMFCEFDGPRERDYIVQVIK